MEEQISQGVTNLLIFLLKIIPFFLILILLVLILYVLLQIFRYRDRKKKALSGVFLLVSLPQWREKGDVSHPQIEWIRRKINVAEQMFGGLYGSLKRYLEGFLNIQEVFSFEIVATAKEIKFYVFIPSHLLNLTRQAILASYPEAEIETVFDYEVFPKEGKATFATLVSTGPPYAPIRTYQELIVDPLNGITSSMDNLKEEEVLILQILASPASSGWRKKGQGFLNKLQRKLFTPRGNPFLAALTSQVLKKSQPIEPEEYLIDQDMFEGVTRKLGKPGFEVTIRAASFAKTRLQAEENLNSLISSFSQFDYPPINSLIRNPIPEVPQVFIPDFLNRYLPIFNPPFYHQKMILNLEEMATIFHFPGEEIETTKIFWLKSKKAPAPTDVSEKGLFLGDNVYRGEKTPIYIKKDDRRRHLYLVGQTGTGKTEYLKFLAWQDIKNDEGVCFIDPHGDAVEDLLRKIPAKRMADVIYFNPGDIERPLGLNVLEAKTDEQKHFLVNAFIALLYKLYDPHRIGIMGPILERAVRNTMLTAMEEEGNTLVEVLRLLTSPEFAATKIPLIKDPLIKTYWTEQLAQTSAFHKSETLAYFTSKFDRFVTERLMRNIVGQSKSAFDFRKVMDEKKILLVNLAKGLIGEENSNFLGLILIPRLLVAAMSRVDIPEEKRQDFYLYVDEFQNFATDYFTEILSEARKYRLNLTVANQYISQIEEADIREAVFGNVGTLGSFRVGVDDAKYLAAQLAPVFSEFDLINNKVGQIYIRLLINGMPSRPFSLSISWDDITSVPQDKILGEKIKRLSRLRFGRDKDLIEVEVIKRAQLAG